MRNDYLMNYRNWNERKFPRIYQNHIQIHKRNSVFFCHRTRCQLSLAADCLLLASKKVVVREINGMDAGSFAFFSRPGT